MLLTDAEIARGQYAGRCYLRCWGALAEKAIAAGRPMYRLRPKLHMIDHIIEDLSRTRENPRYLWNFADEDLMGRIVRLARRQHRSVCVDRTLKLYIMMLRRRWRQWREAQC